ncbi:MAG: GMC family oxidoreductase [Deltaproteobacteria bacterium]|nr:GMC family oxidoreductase [Deltaproteobacteria bacterium]
MVAARALHEGIRPSNVFSREDIHGDTVIDCDVVIVGSGAGGAPMAAELAEAGFDVVVLEEGSYYQTRDFTANTTAMIRQLYRDGGATMALGNPPILFQEGRAVGGSTVINGGMSWRTPEEILERWVKDAKLDVSPAQMLPYYERVEKRMHVAQNDHDAIGKDNWLLKQGADAKGWEIIPNLRNQAHCVGSNRCAFGCPTGAKQSALVSYIPRALHFGARVYSNVRVDKITMHGKRATGVVGHVAEDFGGRGYNIAVRAKLVVAACGAIHTPALLARTGLSSRSGALGGNLSMHPNVKVVALFDEDVTSWKGVHQAFQVREFVKEGIGTFAAVNIPPSLVAMSLPHRGAQLGGLMDRYNQMVVAGMLIEDHSTGRVRTINGRPQAFYQIDDRDIATMKKGLERLSDLLFTAGAKQIILPLHHATSVYSADEARRVLAQPIPAAAWEVVTVHMMGTAKMGRDRTSSVTDNFGFMHDVDRLLISDASLFPTPIRTNPMETIMALATRAAGHVIDNARRFLS